MSNLDGVVPITLSPTTPVPTAEAFDAAGIISGSTSTTWTTPELAREYSSLTALAVDFGVHTPEYREASAYFSQAPTPQKIVVLKLTVPATQKAAVGLNGDTSGLIVKWQIEGAEPNGTNIPPTEVSTTLTGVNDTDIATMVTNFGTALTAFSSFLSAAATGSGGSHVCTITGTAGTYFAIRLVSIAGQNYGPESDGLNLLTLNATTADISTPIATQLAAVRGQNDDWFMPINPYKGDGIDTAIDTYVETIPKLYLCQRPDTAIITHVLSGATDIAANLKNGSAAQTSIMYHSKANQFADAALLGRCLSVAPGFVDFGLRSLVGPTADALSDTQIANARAKNAPFIYGVAGIAIVDGGELANGTFISIMRDRFWIKNQLQVNVLQALLTGNKVPYDKTGAAIVAARIRKTMDQFVGNAISDDPADLAEAFPNQFPSNAVYGVTVPTKAQQISSDVAAGTWAGWVIAAVQVAGIHKVPITLSLVQ